MDEALASLYRSVEAAALGDGGAHATRSLRTHWCPYPPRRPSRYTNASSAPADGCDVDCLGACKQTLLDALWAVNVQDCPPQADIQRCFYYFGDAWTEYAAQCALFQYGSAVRLAAGSGDGELADGCGAAATAAAASAARLTLPPPGPPPPAAAAPAHLPRRPPAQRHPVQRARRGDGA